MTDRKPVAAYACAAPLVSVIMPVRQYDNYVSAAIDSILMQTHIHLELLLITYPGNHEWTTHLPDDPRVRVLARPRPGIVSALNVGIRHAKGDYIARMDADDISLPQRLARQIEYLQTHPDIAIAGARVALFTDSGVLGEGNRHYQQWLNSLTGSKAIRDNIYVESPLPHPTFFAHNTIFRKFGYRDVGWAEDYDFLLRAHLAGLSMGKPENVLLHWRDHDARLTRTVERYSTRQFLQAKGWALAQQYNNRAMWICGLGRNAVQLHDALCSYGIEIKGFVEHELARPRTSRRRLPVITYPQLLERRTDSLIVCSVRSRGVRDQLRTRFFAHQLVEGCDFVVAG